ncbi:ABC transporter ATPase, partial [Achromatium sp. WMS2]
MSILNLRSVSLAFGSQPLLDDVNLSIKTGERICLIGRNGVGKSSLLKIIAGYLKPDQGDIELGSGLRIAYLEQNIPLDVNDDVFSVVAQGLGTINDAVKTYHKFSCLLEQDPSPANLTQLANAQQALEAVDGWHFKHKIDAVLSRLEISPALLFNTLSGGLKRRVLLGRAIVNDPDVLLLDEPTNHLDITSINWLEDFLLNYSGSQLFITHDRRFLERLATRILELDRGQLTDWPGNYSNYLQRREERYHAESKANARFDKNLAQEEIWIRQGIKARRTRNEGRVRNLEQMRWERQQRRDLATTAKMQLQEASR